MAYFFKIHPVILRRISARGNKQHQMILIGPKIVVLLLPQGPGHLLDTAGKVREHKETKTAHWEIISANAYSISSICHNLGHFFLPRSLKSSSVSHNHKKMENLNRKLTNILATKMIRLQAKSRANYDLNHAVIQSETKMHTK